MQKQDIYQSVTDAILAQLEAGCAPWVKPWKDGNATTTKLPNNATTGKAYSGINIPLLWIAGSKYGSQSWLTFKQAVALGGSVMKGERAHRLFTLTASCPKAMTPSRFSFSNPTRFSIPPNARGWLRFQSVSR